MKEHHRKESPILSLLGLGGGIGGGLAGGGSATNTEASGGVIHEYTDGTDKYKVHVFTHPGSFTVTTVGSETDADFLVVGGGGGGGWGSNAYGGGGGAGGYRASTPEGSGGPSPSVENAFTLGSNTYTITVGHGGSGLVDNGAPPVGQNSGNPSSISHPSIPSSYDGSGNAITSQGGGGGLSTPNSEGTYDPGIPGGSGGGPGESNGSTTAASGSKVTGTNTNAPNQGYPSSPHAGPDTYDAGAGGGAGSAGVAGASNSKGDSGGLGKRVLITGPAYSIGSPGNPGNGWVAGGGAGGGSSGQAKGGTGPFGPPQSVGPYAGAGTGGDYPSTPATFALAGTGSGGGGTGAGPSNNFEGTWQNRGRAGGSGVVAIRYKQATLAIDDASIKATGGNVSHYNGKVIHTFAYSGTFVTPGSFNKSCEVVVIGGGGGSSGGWQPGRYAGGGGGAGGMAVCSNFPINGAATQTVTIGQGGEGNLSNGGNNYALNGTPSYFGPGPVPAGVTGLGGGWGGGDQGPRGVDGGGGASQSPGPVGSGGGGGDYNNGNPDNGVGGNAQQPSQTQVANTTNYGNPGGSGSGSPTVNYRRGGGGGGAGGQGATGSSNNNNTVAHGGYGRQLPTTFHDPNSTVGAPGPTSPHPFGHTTSGKYWVCGGGGGGSSHPSATAGKGGGPGAPPTGWAGGRPGMNNTSPDLQYFENELNGLSGTGGGAGGAGSNPSYDKIVGGRGGSGLVLIAYPE